MKNPFSKMQLMAPKHIVLIIIIVILVVATLLLQKIGLFVH
ncbi:MAG: hypothetical protein PHV78_02220 [Patescibacteria group bacterium]|nr:hypothetical protein [Patescibacteria group bacterium]MDD5121036.1 hypothetical protein [Patescibacteria group bacterium]MDD5221603.1 hypothetical protein [Patescibacteria group bacterium]MDD5396045.1 hypothetical protein [Patescibacteria group bacterium]